MSVEKVSTNRSRPGIVSRIRCRTLCAACLVSCLCGCARFVDYAAFVSANRLYERGEYQKATAAYLEIGSKRFPCTAAYDLANVYTRLGEHQAAAALYEEARRVGAGDSSSELAASAYFNEGLSLYEQGHFEEAWRAFRNSLLSAGRDAGFRRDAQYNLELAWRAWKKRTESAPPDAAPTRLSNDFQREAEIRLFERMETGTWRPGKKDSLSGGPDY